jgi:ATP-dependent RNA helicase RhlE
LNPDTSSPHSDRPYRRHTRRFTDHAGGSARSSRSKARPEDTESRGPSFDSFGFPQALLRGVGERGFRTATPIQRDVIPVAREGVDLIACAETGTGKTAAFVLPILERLLARRTAAQVGGAARTAVLILTPTRELAVQIEDDIEGFSYHTGLSSVAVYGGAPSDPQERALRAGVDIIVATPGRLMDHMRMGATDYSGLEVLVLDEADRMMDMGFWPDITRIVSELPHARQTLMFSATMPEEVMTRARAITRDARMIENGAHNGPARTIAHRAAFVTGGQKSEWLATFLRRQQGPVLVFVRTKIGADRLASRLIAQGIRTAALHADRTQQQRSAAVEGLKSGRFSSLVATDVAARGLDIEGITHVINYEVPSTREAYVHRVGRTGRAHLSGTAITLVAPEERRALNAIARELSIAIEESPLRQEAAQD